MQLLQISQNVQNLPEGQKEVSRVTTLYGFLTNGVDLFAVQANEQSVLNSCVLESYFCMQSLVVVLLITFTVPI
jgi:hypothetical protein